MSLLEHLQLGFETALTFQNLFYAFLGCVLGTLVGVLPGLGAVAAISMLLPITFGMDPTSALIMLAGIYYGTAYGASTTAILAKVPGDTAAVVILLDGHEMARKGQAGKALAAAAISSFAAGTVGTVILAAFAVPLAAMAFRFGPADYFSVMLAGLLGAVTLTNGSILKGIGMILIGILLGIVGTDPNSGVQRFTFGEPNLWDGMNFIAVAVGLFAIGEVVAGLETAGSGASPLTKNVGSLMPNKADLKRMVPSILRGTSIGTVAGILPGAGLSIASFFSYSVEKKVSRNRREMGSGAIEGVAGPEAANNAAAQAAFIPTLALGIPGSPTMALILGALIMHNIQPGPQVISGHPALFWGLIASMWIGNLILVILNLPLIGIWVKLLLIPYKALFPAVILFCCLGVFSTQFSTFDLYLTAGFGLAGYMFRKLGCECAPLVLGFVLGPLLEANFRRAMVLSQGDLSTFAREPISLAFLILSAVILAAVLMPRVRKAKDEIPPDEA